MNKNELLKKERAKYNKLHKEELKYGGKTGRAKAFKKANDKLHMRIKQALLNSKTLLDIGCGKGFMIDFFKNNYKHIEGTGIDISKEALKHVTKEIITHCCSADKMPFKDNSFDVVIHQDGMEHILVELEKDVMDEIYRVSNKYIYMTIAIHEIKRDQKKKGNNKVHCNLKSVKEWKRIFIDFVKTKNIKDWLFLADENWIYIYLEK
jgi:ubiquinone/menaquinone biosynthesis C-methylase UbiE